MSKILHLLHLFHPILYLHVWIRIPKAQYGFGSSTTLTAGPEHVSPLGLGIAGWRVDGVQVDDIVGVGVRDVLPTSRGLHNLVGPRVARVRGPPGGV